MARKASRLTEPATCSLDGSYRLSFWRPFVSKSATSPHRCLPDRQSPLWPHLSQSRTSPIRAALHWRANRHSVYAAVSRECPAVHRLSLESIRDAREPLPPEQRCHQLLSEEPHAVRHDGGLPRRTPNWFELSGNG